MKNDSVTKNSMRICMEEIVQKVMDILEAEDGRSFEEKKADVIQYLNEKEDALLAERLLSIITKEESGRCIKTSFWEKGNCLLASDEVILREVSEHDKEPFIELQQQYFFLKSMLKDEACYDMLWNEHREDKALMCSIEVNGVYVGYCGIKNLLNNQWEIAIEILKDWTNQGIGYVAIRAFVEAVKIRMGVSEFRVRIDPGNIASQKLFEKLGAVPNGISEFMIHNEEDLKRCEEENLDLIDDTIITLADKLGVEPRKLLSHVLEYKLVIE